MIMASDQIFKKSKKSICHKCEHGQKQCNAEKLMLFCENDKDLKLAYVARCNGFKNKDN